MTRIGIVVALSILSASANVHAADWTMNLASSELGFTATIESALASGVF